MSGPKGGSYEVVSVEELERRALLASRDRFERARASFESVSRALAGFEPGLETDAPSAVGDSAAVAAAASALEVQVRGLKARLSDHRVAEAIAAIPRVYVDLGEAASAQTGSSALRDTPQISSTPGAARLDVVAMAEALLVDLVRRTGSQSEGDLLRRLATVRAASTAAQGRLALDDLRFAAQQVHDRFRAEERARAGNAAAREAALAILDGCTGSEAARARDEIVRVRAGDPIPISPEAAEELARADRAAADAEFVQNAVVSVLSDLGYQVGGPMTVAVAEGGALLELPGHSHHLARLRSRSGQLQFSVVRVGGNPNDVAGDAAAEVTACDVFEDIRESLMESGVAWTLSRQDPPGAIPVARALQRPVGVAARTSAAARRRRPASEERGLNR